MDMTDNQRFHLVLADIAMAASIKTCDAANVVDVSADDYIPGCIRDLWLERTTDTDLRRRVTALASAAGLALQSQTAEELLESAGRYGIALTREAAEMIAQHFIDKRDAVLTYRR